MNSDTIRLVARCCLALILSFVLTTSSYAGMLSPGDGNERQGYSDMPFPTILGFNFGADPTYNATTDELKFTAFASELELGDEFGPLNPGVHYGISGTIGGSFSARLDVSGVLIDDAGNVTNGGMFKIVLNSTTAGSVGDDYGISAGLGGTGDVLLEGTIGEVLITSGTGGNVLDILFDITGGALQSLTNPDLPGVPFAQRDFGIFHFVGSSIPADWTSNFSLAGGGATLNSFGIPEPTTALLSFLSSALALTVRVRRS